MADFLWGFVAWIVTRKRVMDWLFFRAMKTPYSTIKDPDGEEDYMRRWWLFNRYDRPSHKAWLPSVRLHHIVRPDIDRYLHDHPWDARSILLSGSYIEQREAWYPPLRTRWAGDTFTLRRGEFHRIVHVDPNLGALTLFITYRKRGDWGFLVEGEKVAAAKFLNDR